MANMTKEEWQELYNKLNELHSEFLLNYTTAKNGKNKKIREDADKKARHTILLADNLILKNMEAYELLTGGQDNTDYGRTIIYDEYLQPGYFGRDTIDFLNKIKEKVDGFDK